MCIYFGLDLELQFGEIWTSIVKRPYIAIGMLSWLVYFALFAARLLVRVVRWRPERGRRQTARDTAAIHPDDVT